MRNYVASNNRPLRHLNFYYSLTLSFIEKMHEEGIVINRDYNGNLTPSALFFNIWIQNRSLFYNSVA